MLPLIDWSPQSKLHLNTTHCNKNAQVERHGRNNTLKSQLQHYKKQRTVYNSMTFMTKRHLFGIYIWRKNSFVQWRIHTNYSLCRTCWGCLHLQTAETHHHHHHHHLHNTWYCCPPDSYLKHPLLVHSNYSHPVILLRASKKTLSLKPSLEDFNLHSSNCVIPIQFFWHCCRSLLSSFLSLQNLLNIFKSKHSHRA